MHVSSAAGTFFAGRRTRRTCKMASLCISPVQAGIMLLSTANSSFILLRLLLSIRLCAVFLAILRPAALAVLGCLFFPLAALVAAGLVASLVEELARASSCDRGFIWIIFLDLVGGGGRAKGSSLESLAAEDRRRDFTASAACMGYAAPGEAVSDGEKTARWIGQECFASVG